jgi:Protein of unknown function (DUF4238)
VGDHYIPQYYLRGFCDPSTPEQIYRFEKGTNNVILSHLKNVAQEKGFYSPKVERYLANEVEAPANHVLDRIRNRGSIIQQDKLTLSMYMMALWKRVPASKVRLKSQAPTVAASTFQQIFDEFARRRDADPKKADLWEARILQAKQIMEKLQSDVPREVWLDLIPPGTTPQGVAAMSQMMWRFLCYDREIGFITGDNPVFFFEGIGIGHPQSELTFPISKRIALYASWRTDLPEGYFPASKEGVREINRRTANNTTRYIFYSSNDRRVSNMAVRKKDFRLSRLIP